MDGEPISGGDDPLPGTDDPLDTGDDSFVDPTGDDGTSGVAGGDAPIEDEPDLVEDTTQTEVTEPLGGNDLIDQQVSQRTGLATYSNPTEVILSSGDVNSFEASMNINFDTAEITDGNLSFEDGQGEWFASFAGHVNLHNIEMGITFASHGNNLAEGTINPVFINDTHGIWSLFDLNEIGNVSNKVNGSFELHDGNP